MIELNEKQTALLEFVKEMHGDQKRKYTNEPYWYHPYQVAVLADTYLRKTVREVDMGIEIALCHDLYEDTDCNYSKLHSKLKEIGYSNLFATMIADKVQELTDVYTPENYPDLNREKRKLMEAARLGKCSRLAQSIKYADMIDNTKSIVAHDKKFAPTYLKEKTELLDFMRKGNIDMFVKCCYTLQVAKDSII